MTYITPQKYKEILNYAKEYLPHYVIPIELCGRSGLREFETGLDRPDGTVKVRGRIYNRNSRKVVPLGYYPTENGCGIVIEGKRGVVRTVPTVFFENVLRDWYGQKKTRTTKSFWFFMNKWGYGTHDWRRTFCINFFQLNGSTWEMQQNLIALTGHKSIIETETYLRDWRAVRMSGVFTPGVMGEIKEMMKHIKID